MRKLFAMVILLVFAVSVSFSLSAKIEKAKEFNYDKWSKIPGNVRVTYGTLGVFRDNEIAICFYNFLEDGIIAKVSLEGASGPFPVYKQGVLVGRILLPGYIVIDTTPLYINEDEEYADYDYILDCFPIIEIDVFDANQKKVMFSSLEVDVKSGQLLIPTDKLEKGLYWVQIRWYENTIAPDFKKYRGWKYYKMGEEYRKFDHRLTKKKEFRLLVEE